MTVPASGVKGSAKPIVVFVLGGPGSGKGTQCSKISETYGFVHISAGDCLREERVKADSELGALIEGHIKNGTIVPVEITCELLRRKMVQHGWDNGKFLIDGFPRNANNLEGWQRVMGDSVDVAFCLNMVCPFDEMEKRLLKRGEDSGRIDDNLESIRKRMITFNTETEPIVRLFVAEGKCRDIDARRPIEEVWGDVSNLFAELGTHVAK